MLRGYTPVDELDTNIMASRQALSKMSFPSSEIDKIYAVAEAGKHFVKWSRERVKLSREERPKSDKGATKHLEPTPCDICGNATGMGMIKLASSEQQGSIPSDWQPYLLESFGSLSNNDYRVYVILPAGIVVDYQDRKVYAVCGNCRVVLGLRMTQSWILFHNKIEGAGHGFVDLDRIMGLIQKYENSEVLRALSLVLDFDDVMHDINDMKEKTEKELRGRGIDLYFYVTPPIIEVDKAKLRKMVVESGYFKIFQIGDIEFFPLKSDFMQFRIWCPEALFMIKASDAPKFYEEYLYGAFDLIKGMLNSEGYKLCAFEPGWVNRFFPSEEDLPPIMSIDLKDIKLDEGLL